MVKCRKKLKNNTNLFKQKKFNKLLEHQFNLSRWRSVKKPSKGQSNILFTEKVEKKPILKLCIVSYGFSIICNFKKVYKVLYRFDQTYVIQKYIDIHYVFNF